MRYLPLIFILGFLNAANSQIPTGYLKFVDFNKSADLASNIKKTENGFLIFGHGLGTADNNIDYPSKLEILHINNSGKIISKKEIGKDSTSLWTGLSGSMLTVKDSLFYSIGYYREYFSHADPQDVDPFFVVYDQNGDTIKTIRWRHVGKWSIPHYGVLVSDKTLFISGVYGPATGDLNTILYKTDLDLNIIWQKTFPQPGLDAGYELALLPDNSLMIGSGNGSNTNHDGRLIRTDSTGKLIWQKYYGGNGTDCGMGSIRYYDNNIYGRHCLDTVIDPGDAIMPAYVFQADLNGNINWRFFFNDTNYISPWNFKQASDSTFLLIGQYMYGGITSHLPDVGYAAMVDTAGNLLWERVYEFDTIPDFTGILHDFVVTEDGGFLFVGQGGNDPVRNSDFWIMKTDSKGCLTPGCDTLTSGIGTVSPAFSTHLLKVYPNPASEQLQVQLELSRPAKNITATLYNLQGQAVQELTGSGWQLLEIMDVSKLPGGIYVLKCTADGREVATEKVVVE